MEILQVVRSGGNLWKLCSFLCCYDEHLICALSPSVTLPSTTKCGKCLTRTLILFGKIFASTMLLTNGVIESKHGGHIIKFHLSWQFHRLLEAFYRLSGKQASKMWTKLVHCTANGILSVPMLREIHTGPSDSFHTGSFICKGRNWRLPWDIA